MRIARLTLNAAGITNPVPLSYSQPTFNVSVGVFPSAANTTLACGVQYCIDDQSVFRQANWSQTGTTVTITDGVQSFGQNSSLTSQQNPHGLITGDSVTLLETSTGNTGLGFDGNYTVTVVSPTVYTITVTPSQTAAGACRLVPQRWLYSTAVPSGTSARTIGNLETPATAVRLNVAVQRRL